VSQIFINGGEFLPGDHRQGIVVAQTAGVGVGHERQPTPVRVDALRIARKISPSDQCFNRPAGVRLEDTNDPIGIGKSSPMSRPPVSVPVVEWQALQKPSTRALPRAIRSGVASTLRSGTGAPRHAA
jgi:hypothetical protein